MVRFGILSNVILGLDGGTTTTLCICIPFSTDHHSNNNTLPEDRPPVLARAVAGFSNHNSVGVAALASGTMGKLHGCVLITGTGTIAYGYAEDGREARAAGAGLVLGDWGSGYGIAAQALTAIVRGQDGCGPATMLTWSILGPLNLSSPDELIGWTYADPSWARIAALVPIVVSCAEAGDIVAHQILVDSVQDLTSSVKAVVLRFGLCSEDGKGSFLLVMVGGVLEANKDWDIEEEVIKCISKEYPGGASSWSSITGMELFKPRLNVESCGN